MKSTVFFAIFALALCLFSNSCASTDPDTGCYQDKVQDYSIPPGIGENRGGRDSLVFRVRIELARTQLIEATIYDALPVERGIVVRICPNALDPQSGRVFIKGYEGSYRRMN